MSEAKDDLMCWWIMTQVNCEEKSVIKVGCLVVVLV
jgi:hypothetical protein